MICCFSASDTDDYDDDDDEEREKTVFPVDDEWLNDEKMKEKKKKRVDYNIIRLVCFQSALTTVTDAAQGAASYDDADDQSCMYLERCLCCRLSGTVLMQIGRPERVTRMLLLLFLSMLLLRPQRSIRFTS